MREFLICLIVMSFCIGLTMLISPDGGIKKYISLACSLTAVAALLSMISPGDIGSAIHEGEVTVYDNSERVRQEIINKTIEKINSGIKADLMNKYKIEGGDIDVYANYTDADSIEITEYYIELRGEENMLKPTRIQYYVSEHYGGKCTVVYVENG